MCGRLRVTVHVWTLSVLVGFELQSACLLCQNIGEALVWLLCFWFYWKSLPPGSPGGGREKGRERKVGGAEKGEGFLGPPAAARAGKGLCGHGCVAGR